MLVSLFTLVALAIGIQVSYAACTCNPCAQPCDPCYSSCDPCGCACPCGCCCEKWLNCKCLEDYFCRIGLNECQKCEARKAVEEFKCCTKCICANGCKCESKCECREYRRALRDLDCKMKNIITRCQKPDYKYVRREVKDQVKCCHKCLIWPFKRCTCCDCGCS